MDLPHLLIELRSFYFRWIFETKPCFKFCTQLLNVQTTIIYNIIESKGQNPFFITIRIRLEYNMNIQHQLQHTEPNSLWMVVYSHIIKRWCTLQAFFVYFKQ